MRRLRLQASEINGIKLDFVELSEIKVHYASAGEGDKLVVLLHGFPEFWYSWKEQILALSQDFHVVAPDMRGFNLTDKPVGKKNYEVERLAKDIVELIEALGYEKAFVAGHDWGAGVAWALAADYPEKLEKLACMQVPPGSVWKKNQTLKQFLSSWYMFFFQLPSIPEWLLKRGDFQRLAHGLYSTTAEEGVFSRDDIEKYKESWRQEGAITAALNYYRANILRRLLSGGGESPKITVPTLFIYGEKDHAILPETVKNVEDAIDAEFRELRLPGAAHWVQREKPREVSDSLKEFFTK